MKRAEWDLRGLLHQVKYWYFGVKREMKSAEVCNRSLKNNYSKRKKMKYVVFARNTQFYEKLILQSGAKNEIRWSSQVYQNYFSKWKKMNYTVFARGSGVHERLIFQSEVKNEIRERRGSILVYQNFSEWNKKCNTKEVSGLSKIHFSKQSGTSGASMEKF